MCTPVLRQLAAARVKLLAQDQNHKAAESAAVQDASKPNGSHFAELVEEGAEASCTLQLTAASHRLQTAETVLNLDAPEELLAAAAEVAEIAGSAFATVALRCKAAAIVSEAAHALAHLQHRLALRAAKAAAEARQDGDARRAAEAAMEAGEAAGLAVWAASIGGRDVVRSVRDDQPDALRAVEAAAEDAWDAAEPLHGAAAGDVVAHGAQAVQQASGEAAAPRPTQQAAMSRETPFALAADSSGLASMLVAPCATPATVSGTDAARSEASVIATAPSVAKVPAAAQRGSVDGAAPQGAGSPAGHGRADAPLNMGTFLSEAGGDDEPGDAVLESSFESAAAGPATVATGPPEDADSGKSGTCSHPPCTEPTAAVAVSAPGAPEEGCARPSAAVFPPPPAGLGGGEPSSGSSSTSAAPCAPSPGATSPPPGTQRQQLEEEGELESPAETAAPVAHPCGHGGTALHACVQALASAATHITPDGELPPHALHAASAAAGTLLPAATGFELAEGLAIPEHRTGIMQLLSLAVRQVAEGPGEPVQCATDPPACTVRGSAWRHWQVVLAACLNILGSVAVHLVGVPGSRPGEAGLPERHRECIAAMVSTMLRTDLLPALSCVAAAAAAAAVASYCTGGGDNRNGSSGSNDSNGDGSDDGGSGCGDCSGDGGGSGSSAVISFEGEGTRRDLPVWGLAVSCTCTFLAVWHRLALGTTGDASQDLLQPPLRLRLLRGIRESRLLEHVLRAVVALLGSGSARHGLLAGNLIALLEVAGTKVPASGDDGDDASDDGAANRAKGRPVTMASSHPDLQHLLLLHTLAQLCAVDGGSSYGLPPGAALPALTAGDKAFWPGHAGAAASGGAAAGTVANTAPVSLLDEYVCSALKCWKDGLAHPDSVQPCSPQALWHVCMRLCAAAGSSWQALNGDGNGHGGGGDGGPPYRFTSPSRVQLRALELARHLIGLQSVDGSMRDLWVPVVRAVRRVMTSPGDDLLTEAEDILVELHLPRPDIGGLMPAEPPTDVAAALASGYVACLELTLRRLGRVAGQPAETAAKCLSLASWAMKRFRDMLDLLAYGEPRSLASAIASGAKVLRRGLAEALKAGIKEEVKQDAPVALRKAREQFDAAVSELDCALIWNYIGWWEATDVRPEDRYWWRRHVAAAAAAAAAAEAGEGSGGSSKEQSSGASVAAVDGCGGGAVGGGGGVGSCDGAGCGRLPPLQQQMLLASWTLMQWLSVLSRGALRMHNAPISARIFIMAIVPWVPPLVLAYLDRRAEAAAAEAAADNAPSPHVRSLNEARAAAARAQADSWQRLLFEGMQLMHFFALMAPGCDLMPNADMWTDRIDPVMDAFLHLFATFPDETRLVLCAPVGEGRRGLTLLQALQRCGKTSRCEAARFFHEVITMVGTGRQPGANVLARLRSGDYRVVERGTDESGAVGKCAAHTNSALLAAPLLLPPPCVAAALLRLPLCANPRCTNLEGDSEAGLRLFGCGRCGGAVAYCSRECQVAHWHAGHKAECTSRAG